MVVLYVVVFFFVVAHLGGMFWLSPHLGRTHFDYRISLWFVVRGWCLYGILGWGTCHTSANDSEFFIRRLRSRVDAERSNSSEIADERRLLASLRAIPEDTDGTVRAAVLLSTARLAALRAFDNNAEAAIRLGVLGPDIAAANLRAASAVELVAILSRHDRTTA